MVGARTKQVIQCVVSSKMCRTCLLAEESESTPKPHRCPRNYSGSSKAMEADAALQAYQFLHDASKGTMTLGHIIADDDSSMRSYLRHRSLFHPKGALPLELPEPRWLADPTHRTKVVAKPFFSLAATGKSNTDCTPVDAARIKRWWGHMIKMYRGAPFKRLKQAVDSVLEHLFDDHKYCDIKWCKVLRERQAQQEQHENSPPSDPAGTIGRYDHPPLPKHPLPPARPLQSQETRVPFRSACR